VIIFHAVRHSTVSITRQSKIWRHKQKLLTSYLVFYLEVFFILVDLIDSSLQINTLITLIMIRYLAFERYLSWVNDQHGIASKVCTSNYFCHLNLLFYALIFFNSRLFSKVGRALRYKLFDNNNRGLPISLNETIITIIFAIIISENTRD